MAGEWIKMRRELLSSPKIVRIMSACNADRFRTIGGVFAAWCVFDEHSADGILPGYTPETLDEIVGFAGLTRAMIAVGWVAFDAENMVLTALNFTEHNGKSSKRRAQDAVRKMSAREADKNRTPSSSYSSSYSSSTKKKKGVGKQYVTSVPEGVEEQIWNDWLAVRKAKGSKGLTLTTWRGIENQASIAGITINGCVEMMAQREWKAFNAGWLDKTQDRPRSSNGSSHSGYESNKEFMERIIQGSMRGDSK